MRECATGQPCARAVASRCRVFSIACGMFPPPNTAGSAKPLTRSMISSPYGACGSSCAPKPCWAYTAPSFVLTHASVQYLAIAHHGAPVQAHRAVAQRNINVAGRGASAPSLVVRPQGKQEVALEGPRIHPDRVLARVQPQRGPVAARLQAPADVRDRVAFRI